MQRAVAPLAKAIGQITILVAIALFFWTVIDLAQSNDSAVFQGPTVNPYLSALGTSATIAVYGMIAVGLGHMLERFTPVPDHVE